MVPHQRSHAKWPGKRFGTSQFFRKKRKMQKAKKKHVQWKTKNAIWILPTTTSFVSIGTKDTNDTRRWSIFFSLRSKTEICCFLLFSSSNLEAWNMKEINPLSSLEIVEHENTVCGMRFFFVEKHIEAWRWRWRDFWHKTLALRIGCRCSCLIIRQCKTALCFSDCFMATLFWLGWQLLRVNECQWSCVIFFVFFWSLYTSSNSLNNVFCGNFVSPFCCLDPGLFTCYIYLAACLFLSYYY